MRRWLTRDLLVDGRRIVARDKGPGRLGTVVLLHDLGGTQLSWDRVANHLTGFRVVTFDYRGHGRSDPSAEYSVDGLLDDLRAVMNLLDIGESSVLVGHSIGADLALLHASSGGKCRGLVFVDGALTVSPPQADWERLPVMENRSFFKVLTFIGRRMGVAPAMSLRELRLVTDDLENRRVEFGSHLAGLDVPCLYVIGDKADKVPDGPLIHERKMSSVSEIASRYDVWVEYVPCGHLVPMRQSKRLGELLRDFSIPPLV